MNDARIEIAEPTREELVLLEERIYEFNVEATGIDDGRWLGVFVRDEGGAILAGLTGSTWGGYLRIRDFWVRPGLRRQGLGSGMLRAAEDEARRRGCSLVQLATHSFQAPEFYRKHGYREFAALEGAPAGHREIFLAKHIEVDPEKA